MSVRVLLMALTLAIAGCEDHVGSAPHVKADIENHTGTVRELAVDTFGIVGDAEAEHFLPSNLPAEFQVDGQRVLFSGNRLEIPPNVRLWGAPLQLTEIRADLR
jgi:hypothetical protein